MTVLYNSLYPRDVPRVSPPERSPTLGLLLGLIITLSAVVAYSVYITWQISGLRKLQTDLVDRNRKDSLQLLRIQNDLNLLAVAMRDMVSNDEPYPLTAWQAQFQRIRIDLDDAMRLESGFAAANRTPEQSAFLAGSFTQFWDAVDRVFSLAQANQEKDARDQIQLSLQERQAAGEFDESGPGCIGAAIVDDGDFVRNTLEAQLESQVFDSGDDAAFLVAGGSFEHKWAVRVFSRV